MNNPTALVHNHLNFGLRIQFSKTFLSIATEFKIPISHSAHDRPFFDRLTIPNHGTHHHIIDGDEKRRRTSSGYIFVNMRAHCLRALFLRAELVVLLVFLQHATTHHRYNMPFLSNVCIINILIKRCLWLNVVCVCVLRSMSSSLIE